MKTYDFRFVSDPAKFDGGHITVTYDPRPLSTELKHCTLADAIAYLPAFSRSAPVPNRATFWVVNEQRLPSGYKKARRSFDFNPGTTPSKETQ